MIQVTSENGSNLVNFNTEKNRDGDKTSWAAEAVWTESEFYLRSSESKQSGNREAYVIKYLSEHGPSFIEDIMANADICNPQGARQGVYILNKLGKVRRINPGEQKAKYELT